MATNDILVLAVIGLIVVLFAAALFAGKSVVAYAPPWTGKSSQESLYGVEDHEIALVNHEVYCGGPPIRRAVLVAGTNAVTFQGEHPTKRVFAPRQARVGRQAAGEPKVGPNQRKP